ncbi:MAG TPA: SRPBCC family protein [Polyangia bacterium]|nr:SRPBCC family protein [Polyangia bacterium]
MSTVPPVRKELVVAASADHAFKVFTDGIDRWWPRQHHIGKSPLRREVLEAGVGGRWYGLSEDGTECDVGRVLVWDPPHRLVLAWQITSDWKFDPDFVTEVEVTFTAEGPRTTRLVLEHRDLHRYGLAEPAYRRSIDSPTGGWGFILQRFADEAARA